MDPNRRAPFRSNTAAVVDNMVKFLFGIDPRLSTYQCDDVTLECGISVDKEGI